MEQPAISPAPSSSSCPSDALEGPPAPFPEANSLGSPSPLASLLSARATASKGQLFSLCEAAIEAESRSLAPLEQQSAALSAEVFRARYHLARLLLFLRAEGLLSLRQCRSLPAYCRKHWPGAAVCQVQLLRYLFMAERTPEDVALSGRASLGLLRAIAALEDPACRGRLHDLIRRGRPPKAIWRGVRAAATAAALPGEQALAQLDEAIAGPSERRALKRTKRRIDQDAERLCVGVTQLLQEAAELGLFGEVRERLLGALGPAETAERRRTERTGEAQEADAGAGAAKLVSPAAAAGPADPGSEDPAADAGAEAAKLVSPPASVAPAAAAIPAPARRPPLRTPYQQHLPVGYPADDYAATPAEGHAARAIVAMELSHRAAEQVIERTRQEGDEIADELMLHYQRAYTPFRAVRLAVEARIEAPAEEGRAALSARLAAEPERAAASFYPVQTDPAQVSLPCSFLTLDVIDPLCDPAPTEAERRLHLVLACLAAAAEELARLLLRLDAGDEVAADVYHQLRLACAAAGRAPVRLRVLFHDGALAAERQEAACAPEREAERLRRQQADDALVVLGESALPSHYVKVAETDDGTHIAISLHTGQVIVVFGAQGMGKSHLGVLLLEGLLLQLFGLNRGGDRPGSAVVFAADWRKGHTRHQHLQGFFPNPRLPEWDHLRRRYGAAFALSNAAYQRAILACLPGTAARYRALYPDLMERGLEVREVRLHPREWSNFGYHLFLGCADKLGGRTQAQVYLSNLIAQLGPDAHIDHIQREFERSRLGGASRPVLQGALSLIRGLTSDSERVADLVAEPGTPVLCYLESDSLGAEQILSIQLAMMTALNRTLCGDPYLLYVLEEVAKQGISPELMAAFCEMVREVRHHRRSLFFGAHLPTDLPVDVVSMASGVFQFGGTSHKALRRLQELSGLLLGVTVQEVMALGRGMAYGGFQQATNPDYVRRPHRFHFRPSCLDAGGETLTRR